VDGVFGTHIRLRGGILSKSRRGELITPLPVGRAYDAAGHVILDPDTAVRGALAHLFTTLVLMLGRAKISQVTVLTIGEVS
jgi:hypothetical protein